jgi:hypothetical protein
MHAHAAAEPLPLDTSQNITVKLGASYYSAPCSRQELVSSSIAHAAGSDKKLSKDSEWGACTLCLLLEHDLQTSKARL